MGDSTNNDAGWQSAPQLKLRSLASEQFSRGYSRELNIAVSVSNLCDVLEHRVTSPGEVLRSILRRAYEGSNGMIQVEAEQMMDGTWRQPVVIVTAHRDLLTLIEEVSAPHVVRGDECHLQACSTGEGRRSIARSGGCVNVSD